LSFGVTEVRREGKKREKGENSSSSEPWAQLQREEGVGEPAVHSLPKGKKGADNEGSITTHSETNQKEREKECPKPSKNFIR